MQTMWMQEAAWPQDAERLKALMKEFEQLNRLSGACQTPQARGQRFNGVIAEMLQCWGIGAEPSTPIPGVGELDVTFIVDGQRYLAEAKWEKAKTDIAPILKLRGRLKQRLRGTVGVFFSMAGYTPEVISGIDKGEQLDMLLFGRDHFEAMLSGLVPPQELLELAINRAAFAGKPDSTVLDLLAPKQTKPQISWDWSTDASATVSDTQDVSTRVVLTMHSTNLGGMSLGSKRNFLITHEDGIVDVRPAKRKASWKVPVRGCQRHPHQAGDGSVYFARKNGIARFADGELSVVGGGFAVGSTIVTAPDGSLFVVEARPLDNPLVSVVMKLGEGLGQQRATEIVAAWSGAAVGGAWLNDRLLALVHMNFCSVTALDGKVSRGVATGIANCASIVALDERSVLVGGGNAEIRLIDLVTGRGATVARLASFPSVIELVGVSDTEVYAACGWGQGGSDITVFAVEAPLSSPSFRRQLFAQEDSGNLAEYAEQVQAIKDREMPDPMERGPELNATFNGVIGVVHEKLDKPLMVMLEEVGLQRRSDDVRPMEGWPPPEYGGSATHTRWRQPRVKSGPWVEVLTGVSHRMWPKQNLNDMIITLFVVIMNDRTQHTVLTRLVPTELHDIGIQQKIEGLLVDVGRALPTAIEYLDPSPTSDEDSD
jgi:hypothetical protein